jgi:hypothetical protein
VISGNFFLTFTVTALEAFKIINHEKNWNNSPAYDSAYSRLQPGVFG